MKTEETTQQKQLRIINSGNHAEIMRLIGEELLCEKAQLLLIKRGNPEEINAYIISDCPIDSLDSFDSMGTTGLVLRARRGAERQPKHFFCKKAEIALIKRGVTKEIIEYIIRKSFDNEKSKVAIIKRGIDKEIKALIIHSFLKEISQIALINSGNTKMIKHYISTRSLSLYYKPELLLIKRGITEEIELYISKHGLCRLSQRAFIKRAKTKKVTREIMFYISKRRFYDETQLDLIKRGVTEEIMFYISKWNLHEDAEIALINRGKIEEIKVYISLYGFCDEAKLVLADFLTKTYLGI